MGNCCGDSKEKKVKLFEDRLYALCMKYEFDLVEGQLITFNELFRRENCNELGQQFNEDSAKVIIMEFRKFMFLCGAQLAKIRRTKGYNDLNPRHFNDGAKTVAYECPYNAPPYVDRVWRSMIAYDSKYKDICYKICYGYLLRRDPRQNPGMSLTRYNQCRADMYSRREKLYPFHNVWPEYRTEMEFYNDFVFTVWAAPSTINRFGNYLEKVPLEQGQISAQMCIAQSQKIKADYQRKFPPECQGRPNYKNAYIVNMNPQVHHPYINRQDPGFRQKAISFLMQYKLPSKFEEFVAQELMVSIDQANDIIFEYRRFIFMIGNSGYKLYPSEQVEKVWLIHMAHSTNYVKMCNEGIGIVPYHLPFTGNTTGYNDREVYDNTLSLYHVLFSEPGCSSCWPPGEFRFQPENFQCMFVNLIRLAGLYWANMQGHLKSHGKHQPKGYNNADPGIQEKKDKLKEKKEGKEEGVGKAGVAAGVAGVGAGVVLAAGGLALVANPNTADFNDSGMLDPIVDGFHDGLSVLGDISIGDILEVGEGALDAFEGIDWPDIDFDGFADVAGDLFGDAGEFFAGAGEAIGDGLGAAADGVGDLIGGIGDGFDW